MYLCLWWLLKVFKFFSSFHLKTEEEKRPQHACPPLNVGVPWLYGLQSCGPQRSQWTHISGCEFALSHRQQEGNENTGEHRSPITCQGLHFPGTVLCRQAPPWIQELLFMTRVKRVKFRNSPRGHQRARTPQCIQSYGTCSAADTCSAPGLDMRLLTLVNFKIAFYV